MPPPLLARLALAGVSLAALGVKAGSARAQELPIALQPPPPVSTCVARYGHTGCAARLYAEVLCEIVGQRADLYRVHSQLQRRYSEEQINFIGVATEQVETTAVRYYVPQLCPPKKQQIWDLLLSREAG